MGTQSLEMAGRQTQGQILLRCNPGEANGNLLRISCPIRTQELCTCSVAVVHPSGGHQFILQIFPGGLGKNFCETQSR